MEVVGGGGGRRRCGPGVSNEIKNKSTRQRKLMFDLTGLCLGISATFDALNARLQLQQEVEEEEEEEEEEGEIDCLNRLIHSSDLCCDELNELCRKFRAERINGPFSGNK